MTSYEFEVAAKNAAISLIKYKYGIEVTIAYVHMVWFTHILGSKKCMLYAEQIPNTYIEVTYSSMRDEMYIDLYEKYLNQKIPSEQFNFKAK